MVRSFRCLGALVVTAALVVGGCAADQTEGDGEDESGVQTPTTTDEALHLSDLCGIICGGMGGAACVDLTGVPGAFACGAAGAAACDQACQSHLAPVPSEKAAEACLRKIGIGAPHCNTRNNGYRHCTGHWGSTNETGLIAVSWNQRHDRGMPMNVSWKIGPHFRPISPVHC